MRKRNSARHLALGIYLVTFTLLARTSTQPLDCVTMTVGDFQEQAPAFTRTNPAVQCGGSLPDYRKYVALGVLVLVLVVVSMVCLVRMLRDKVASCGGDGQRLRSDQGFVQAFGVLFLRYDPQHYYWEVLVLSRKLVIVLAQQLLAENPVAQITVCAVTLLASLVAQCCCKALSLCLAGPGGGAVAWRVRHILVVGTACHTGAVSETATSGVYFATLGVTCALATVPLRKMDGHRRRGGRKWWRTRWRAAGEDGMAVGSPWHTGWHASKKYVV